MNIQYIEAVLPPFSFSLSSHFLPSKSCLLWLLRFLPYLAYLGLIVFLFLILFIFSCFVLFNSYFRCFSLPFWISLHFWTVPLHNLFHFSILPLFHFPSFHFLFSLNPPLDPIISPPQLSIRFRLQFPLSPSSQHPPTRYLTSYYNLIFP